jgi:CBS domain-containing protein
MKVADVMSRDVLTVEPQTPLRDVARLLFDRGISGVPVCDGERRVLGVVSEGDILFKEHDPASDARRGRLAWLLAPDATQALAKAHAVTAGEAMSTPAITISPYRSVAAAARLMVERGVNRLPVLRDGVLVGIVSRADLVRAFVRRDDEIAREIREDVLHHALWLEPNTLEVEVVQGAVKLSGTVPARSDARVVVQAVGRVPGVVTVESALTWNVDDTGGRAMQAVSGDERRTS